MYEFLHSQGQSLQIDAPAARAQCPLYLQQRPNIGTATKRREVPRAAVSTLQQTAALFDQLVGEQLDRVGHLDAESLGRLQVDDELELGRLHHR